MILYEKSKVENFIQAVKKGDLISHDLKEIRKKELDAYPLEYSTFRDMQVDALIGARGYSKIFNNQSWPLNSHLRGELVALGMLNANLEIQLINGAGLVSASNKYFNDQTKYLTHLEEVSNARSTFANPQIISVLKDLKLLTSDILDGSNSFFIVGYTGVFAAAKESQKYSSSK